MHQPTIMEAMMTEEKPQTPAPATPAAATVSTPAPADAKPAATVDAPAKPEGMPEGAMPKALKKDLYDLRQKNREYRAKLEALENELKAIRSTPAPAVQVPTPSDVSIFDNPEQYLARREAALIKQFEERATALLSQKETTTTRMAQVEAAEKWLRTQKEFQENPDALEEIADILVENPRLARVKMVDPELAAEKAYEMWRSSKGVDRDTTKDKAAAAAPPPTGAAVVADAGKVSLSAVKAKLASLDATKHEDRVKIRELTAEAEKALRGGYAIP